MNRFFRRLFQRPRATIRNAKLTPATRLGLESLEGRVVLSGNPLTGGSGNDTFVFAGGGLGSDTVTEAPGVDTDTLDFSKFGPAVYAVANPPPGVSVNLNSTAAQVANPGNLTLTLSSAAGIENVVG